MARNAAKILVVDDVQSIRLSISEYLAKEFQTKTAGNSEEAINICKHDKIDLVITDIKMPGMSGIELIHTLRKDHPDMQFALMTAYNVDDFISFAREEEIWNIVPKSMFLDIDHILILARKLLGKDPFGIHHYFSQARIKDLQLSDLHRMHKAIQKNQNLAPNLYYICHIGTQEENKTIEDKTIQLLLSSGAPPSTQQVIEELRANVMRYTEKQKNFDLCFGMFDDYTAVGLVDYDGSLDRKQILSYLERQATIDSDSGLPIGLEDPHGRGLYISREQCEHLVFNLAPGKKTEIIGVLSTKPSQRSRAISIFQMPAGDSKGYN